MVADHPDAEGARNSRGARRWWNTEWDGETFMAVGMPDPVLGPPAMKHLREQILHCPPPLEVAEGRHFVQEWGEKIAERALEAFR